MKTAVLQTNAQAPGRAKAYQALKDRYVHGG